MDGVTVVKKVWGGRASFAEYKAEVPAGKVELPACAGISRWPINGTLTSPRQRSASCIKG
jgi:hypothetical protein